MTKYFWDPYSFEKRAGHFPVKNEKNIFVPKMVKKLQKIEKNIFEHKKLNFEIHQNLIISFDSEEKTVSK